MPSTPIYGWVTPEQDDVNDVAQDLQDLAEAVETDLNRVETDVAGVAGDLADLTGRVDQLAHVSLSGVVGGTGTPLVVPAALRGTFRSYTLRINAGVAVATTSPTPILVRINGDDGTNYRSNAIGWNTATGDVGISFANAATAFPRTGYAGIQNRGLSVITFSPGSLGTTGVVTWVGQGWMNHSGTTPGLNLVWQSGGRWSGATAEVEGFYVRTTNPADEWASGSFATLWGHR